MLLSSSWAGWEKLSEYDCSYDELLFDFFILIIIIIIEWMK